MSALKVFTWVFSWVKEDPLTPNHKVVAGHSYTWQISPKNQALQATYFWVKHRYIRVYTGTPLWLRFGPPGVGTQQQTFKYFSFFELALQAGVCCGPCNPSKCKWEARIWGWLAILMAWGQESCCTVCRVEPASALSLASTWTLWGNPGWPGCLRKCDSGQGRHPAAQSARGEQ